MKANNSYFPLRYTRRVKKRATKYLFRVILGDDFLVILLAFNWAANQPLLHGIGLFFMLISFWCIYEVGYLENDLVGEKYEDNPVLSSTYKLYKQRGFSCQPWLYSLLLATIGIVIVEASQNYGFYADSIGTNSFISLLRNNLSFWLIFLLCVRFLFRIYNYANKQTRVWFYLILQICRYFGFAIVIQTSTIGTIFLIGNTITRFIPYILYRYMGGKSGNWPKEFPTYFFRFIFYIFLLLGLVLCSPDLPLSLLVDKQTLFIALFCIVRGSLQIWRVLFQSKPVWKDSSNRAF